MTTDREVPAILRMENPAEYGNPGVKDFIAVENLRNRHHDRKRFPTFDG